MTRHFSYSVISAFLLFVTFFLNTSCEEKYDEELERNVSFKELLSNKSMRDTITVLDLNLYSDSVKVVDLQSKNLLMFPKLKAISISNAKVTGIDTNFKDCENIRSITFEDCLFPRSNEQFHNLLGSHSIDCLSITSYSEDATLNFYAEDLHTSSIKTLSMSGKFAKNINGLDFSQMKSLRKLSLYCLDFPVENIKKSKVFNCDSIESIDLSYINEGRIVTAFRPLKRLKRLTISNCTKLREYGEEYIPVLPSEIDLSSFPNLTYLNLSYNQLEGLEFVGSPLPHLDTLEISSVDIAKIPKSVYAISSLRCLDLSNNGISVLEEGFHNWHELQCLRINDNKLLALPRDINALQNLHELDVSDNKLTAIPNSLFKCVSLEVLRVNNNFIKSVNKNLANLKRLRLLDIGHNPLSDLPATFTKLDSLKSLSVSAINWKHPEAILDSISTLSGLTELNLDSCNVAKIPNAFVELNKLNSINLEYTLIESKPDVFEGMPNLKSIRLPKEKSSFSFFYGSLVKKICLLLGLIVLCYAVFAREIHYLKIDKVLLKAIIRLRAVRILLLRKLQNFIVLSYKWIKLISLSSVKQKLLLLTPYSAFILSIYKFTSFLQIATGDFNVVKLEHLFSLAFLLTFIMVIFLKGTYKQIIACIATTLVLISYLYYEYTLSLKSHSSPSFSSFVTSQSLELITLVFAVLLCVLYANRFRHKVLVKKITESQSIKLSLLSLVMSVLAPFIVMVLVPAVVTLVLLGAFSKPVAAVLAYSLMLFISFLPVLFVFCLRAAIVLVLLSSRLMSASVLQLSYAVIEHKIIRHRKFQIYIAFAMLGVSLPSSLLEKAKEIIEKFM